MIFRNEPKISVNLVILYEASLCMSIFIIHIDVLIICTVCSVDFCVYIYVCVIAVWFKSGGLEQFNADIDVVRCGLNNQSYRMDCWTASILWMCGFIALTSPKWKSSAYIMWAIAHYLTINNQIWLLFPAILIYYLRNLWISFDFINPYFVCAYMFCLICLRRSLLIRVCMCVFRGWNILRLRLETRAKANECDGWMDRVQFLFFHCAQILHIYGSHFLILINSTNYK